MLEKGNIPKNVISDFILVFQGQLAAETHLKTLKKIKPAAPSKLNAQWLSFHSLGNVRKCRTCIG